MTSEFTFWLPRLQAFCRGIDLTRTPPPRVLVRRVSKRRVKIRLLGSWLSALPKRSPTAIPRVPMARTFTRWFTRHLSEHEHPAAREGVPPK